MNAAVLRQGRTQLMFDFPEDVRAYVQNIFGGANAYSSTYLTQVPNAHEPALDIALVSYIARHSRPVHLPSDWVVKLDTHFLGSGHHWRQWEIADIGLLLMFRRRGELLRTKVALLQSKRLYPNEQKRGDEADYVGFGRLHESDEAFLASLAPLNFTFKPESRYKALSIESGQYSAITDYEMLSQIPVYYFFYNPTHIPVTIELPCTTPDAPADDIKVGCRVLPAQVFRDDVAPKLEGLTPSYADLCLAQSKPFDDADNTAGWRLDDFVVNRFMGCQTGYRVDTKTDTTLANLFGGRSAPISAAISINIDVPQGVDPIEA